MKTLTIRVDDKDSLIIEKLKEVVQTSTASKALVTAAKQLPELSAKCEHLQRELHSTKIDLNNLQTKVDRFFVALNLLQDSAFKGI